MTPRYPYIGDPPDPPEDPSVAYHERIQGFGEEWLEEMKRGDAYDAFVDAVCGGKNSEEIFETLRRHWRFDPHSLLSKMIDDAVREHVSNQGLVKAEMERREKEAREP